MTNWEKNKRKFNIVILAIVLLFLLTGCSEGSLPSNTNPENIYAVLTLQDGSVVQGNVEEFHRYSEGCVEIHIDGKIYYVHSYRVDFIENNG